MHSRPLWSRFDNLLPLEGKMIHLTHTGFYAGTPYCGVHRGIDGETYMHPNPAFLDKQENRSRVCPECLKIWDSAVSYEVSE